MLYLDFASALLLFLFHFVIIQVMMGLLNDLDYFCVCFEQDKSTLHIKICFLHDAFEIISHIANNVAPAADLW